ncbi:dtdp-glucose-partial [Plasmopara halstedii]|uniref:Dtdp-glucose-partial n=1 Tax=Plasmopara halstedii TaxID=4781 RepID=A0A0P1AV12_PLAHL|nr:dtdp-glucose-partial [Plasmopara halstedii]CEG44922.1 dtdp-glucose-partial [Plasmopara halstedii]
MKSIAQTTSVSIAHYTKRILVTGGAGFIGSHVVIYLVKHYPQYYIVNLDSLEYCSCVRNVHTAITTCNHEQNVHAQNISAGCVKVPHEHLSKNEDGEVDVSQLSFCEPGNEYVSNEFLATLPSNYKFIHGDISSADLVGYVLKTECIDTIMHFAAESHVDHSFGNSIEFSKTNILGTHVLLEAARLHRINRFIHVSTDEVYGEVKECSKPMSEEHVLELTNPYAATKAGAEFLVKSYHRSFGLPTIITRSNNVFGPHQYPEKLIPKFINQILRDRPVTVHGDGMHTRNYLYISDVVDAFDLILHKGKVGEVYNIGGKNEVSNKNVAMDLLALIKPQLLDHEKIKFITHVSDRPFNDQRYVIDASKISRLGWTEKVTWQAGLRKTVDWFRRHGHRFDNIDHALEAHPVNFKKTFKIF